MATVEEHELTAVDEQRFTDAYLAHYADVFGYLARRAPLEDARDAAAEVFTVAWRRLHDMPGDPATLPWLYRVAVHVLANQRRSHRRRRDLLAKLASAPVPAVVHDTLGGSPEVSAALVTLSDRDREIILLNAWEGLPSSQLAVVFDISPPAAERRLSRAKKRFARALDAGDRSRTPSDGPRKDGRTP